MGKLWRIDILVTKDKKAMLLVKLRKTMPVYVSATGAYVTPRNWPAAKRIAKQLRKPSTGVATHVTVIARYAAANNISYEDAAKLFGPLSNRKTS